MAIRPSQSGSEGENFETIAHDLLGVHFSKSEALDDSMELEGLSLDDLGFGAPPTPEPIKSESKPVASATPQELEAERQAELKALLSGGRQFVSAAESSLKSGAFSEPAPRKKPAALWNVDASEDDFGAGLLAEAQPSTKPSARTQPVQRVESSYDDIDDFDDDSAPETSAEAAESLDDFGGDILPERPRRKQQERPEGRRRKPRAEKSVAPSTPVEADPEESAAEESKDAYWDALENWDWNEGDSASKRRPPAGRKDEGSKPHSRQRGRRNDSRRDDRPQRPDRAPAREPLDLGEEPAHTSSRAEAVDAPGPERKQRPGSRNRGNYARDEQEQIREPKAEKDIGKKRRPPQSRPPEPPRPPVGEAEFEDEFGMGVLDAPALIENFEEVETESAAQDNPEKRGRRRRRRGRRGPDPKNSQETIHRSSDDFAADDDPFDQPSAEAGDDFGAGVISEEPRARRRPPRQEKAVRPADDERRRPHREQQPTPAREPARRERQPAPQPAAQSIESADDRYKGIPTWVEAIGYLARKPPASRSSGDDRGQRSRGGRRRGGNSGGKPRR